MTLRVPVYFAAALSSVISSISVLTLTLSLTLTLTLTLGDIVCATARRRLYRHIPRNWSRGAERMQNAYKPPVANKLEKSRR